MSSSSSPSSSSLPSSSSAASTSQGGNAAGPSSSTARRGRGRGRGRRRAHDFEGPSSSRRRAVNEVWPEPFIEALAAQVAIDASRNLGRLAAAAALANVFQVCSTWRAVSRSNPLWHRLTSRIWGRSHLLRNRWRDEYVYWHRTARNFYTGNCIHTILNFDRSDVDGPDGLTCRCLTLSDTHLACGFADGAVRLFDLTTRFHVATYRPHHGAVFGQFSRAVVGIIMTDLRLTFATLDGDIHVAIIGNGLQMTERIPFGDVVNDGALVDFTGCGRWWVGLYAGVPGRAFHIWDANSRELVFVGGSLTDPEAVIGWHMLTEMTEFVGRVRVTSQESAVACTRARVIVFDLRNQGVVLGEEEYRRGIIVTSMDVSNEAYVIVGSTGLASVRRVETLEEVCRFRVRGAVLQRGVMMGSMNRGYALMCGGGVVRVWEVERGEYRYDMLERVGEVNALVCDERHVAACSSGATTLHLWDFGATE